MKFLHLGDLHIGKKLNEYPLYEDQRHVLLQAIDLAKSENVDVIVIAGDIYDSSAPSAEAMEFYDWLLGKLFSLHKPILIISGNHDSPERLAVASSILRNNEIYIVTKIEDCFTPVDICGNHFYLLPYFRISEVNRLLGSEVKSYSDALKLLLVKMNLDISSSNVLLAHQAFLPLGEKMECSGSETSLDVDSNGYVGGSEVIDASLLSSFDYAALGHIHKAQNIAANARYCGALLKYHIDEANAKRSFSIVEIIDKRVSIFTYPVSFLRDLVILQGSLEEIMSMEGHEKDYVYCKLLDHQLVDSPMSKLKAKYPYCLGLEYPSIKVEKAEKAEFDDVETVDKNVLFEAFFSRYGGGRELDEKEKEFVKSLLKKGEEA